MPCRNFGLGFVAVENDRLFLTTLWFAKLRQCFRDLVAGLRNIRTKGAAISLKGAKLHVEAKLHANLDVMHRSRDRIRKDEGGAEVLQPRVHVCSESTS